MNNTVSVIGLDIAKNIFVAVGLDVRGKQIVKAKLNRSEVLPFFANYLPTAIGIEACAGAHYWARKLNGLGHDARLIAAQHVKPFVKGSKNDTNDAHAIAEVRSRASTKYVQINTEAQQDMQMLHRARQGVMGERKALICRLRALIGEYGVVFALGAVRFRKELSKWLGSPDNGLSGLALRTLQELTAQLDAKEMQLDQYDKRIGQIAKEDVRATRLMQVPGVGKLTATAVLAAVSDPHHFGSGRDMAANLGLVPRQHSSGGKEVLLGITKRGDSYLRTLLIHGARSALRVAHEKPDRMLRWALKLQQRKNAKIAAVALANKMARVIWAMLANDRDYSPLHTTRQTT
jgi:transposase